MDVNVRDHGGSQYTVHVSLDKGEVNNAFNRTYQQLSERGGVKGFRPGKVPRKILDRYYEETVIRAFTYEELVQKRLEEAMEEENLRPIDQLDIQHGAPCDDDEDLADRIKSGLVEDDPEADEAEAAEAEAVEAEAVEAEAVEAEAAEPLEEAAQDPEESLEDAMEDVPLVEGEPFDFYVTFTAYPRPQLPELADLKLKRPVSEVSDEAINRRLEQLRQINAEEVETDREKIADGDEVVVDLNIVVEGEDPDETDARQEEIIVGSRDYIGDIDDALIGQEPGDIVEVEYTFDEDHPDATLAGNSARIIAEIDSFSARELPELTDEFAQSVGEYETMDELRDSIREQIQAELDREADEELRSQVMRHVLQNTEVELPEQFIQEAMDRELEDLRRQLQQTGMSIEEFAEANDMDEDELRENQRAQAVASLKLQVALQNLARERDVDLTEEDLAAELQRIAAQAGGDMEFVQQAAALQPNFMEEVQDRVMRRLVLEDIISDAEIEEVSAEEYKAWVEELREADGQDREDDEQVEDESATSEPSEEAAEEDVEDVPEGSIEDEGGEASKQEGTATEEADAQESEDE